MNSILDTHKPLVLVALVVGALVRMLKDDHRFPITLSKRARPWVALLLGLVLGAVQQRLAGATWLDAVCSGLLAGALPILGHQLGIESILGGKELPFPGTKKRTAKSDDDDKPPTSPNGMSPLLVVLLLGSASTPLVLGACPGTAKTPRDVARGSVLVLVHAASEGDAVCAAGALALGNSAGGKDPALLQRAIGIAERCAKAKKGVLASASSTAYAIDAWDDAASPGKIGCAAVASFAALGDLRAAIVETGATVPPVLDDALAAATRLSAAAPNVCPAAPASTTSSVTSTGVTSTQPSTVSAKDAGIGG
jgi:hypothetical protein